MSEKDLAFIREYLTTLTDDELLLNFSDLELKNNTGTMQIMITTIEEFERRGLSFPELSTFKNDMRVAVEKTLAKRK